MMVEIYLQRFLWPLGPAAPELELTEGGHSCPRLPAASPRRSNATKEHKNTLFPIHVPWRTLRLGES